MNPSVLREILKLTERPGVISFAGGLPSPLTFPVREIKAACETVLLRDGAGALQYSVSEGYGPLREYIAAKLPWPVNPGQVLITTGSQQAFDLLAKVLLDRGSRVLVESPTYLGALQAFAALDADVVAVDTLDQGLDLDDMSLKSREARFIHIQPNFQNPTGRTLPHAQRLCMGTRLIQLGLPFVEDDPYGALWFDEPPPPPVMASFPEHGVYLGSFSKVLAPGLRLGFLVAPPSIFPKLLQAKQAADLHTSTLDQRLAYEVIKDGFLDQHIPAVRVLYKNQRDIMLESLSHEMAGLDVQWTRPAGGMFLWVRLPAGMNAQRLLGQALREGVAFVPGAPFFAGVPDQRTLRLSFVNPSEDQIRSGIRTLAQTIRAAEQAEHLLAS